MRAKHHEALAPGMAHESATAALVTAARLPCPPQRVDVGLHPSPTQHEAPGSIDSDVAVRAGGATHLRRASQTAPLTRRFLVCKSGSFHFFEKSVENSCCGSSSLVTVSTMGSEPRSLRR